MTLIVLSQDKERMRAVVNAIMNLRVPYNAGYFWIIWGRVNFSGRTLLPPLHERGCDIEYLDDDISITCGL